MKDSTRIFSLVSFIGLSSLSYGAFAGLITSAPTEDAHTYSFDQGPAIVGMGPATRQIGPTEFTWSSVPSQVGRPNTAGLDYNLGSVDLGFRPGIRYKGFWNQENNGFAYTGSSGYTRFEFETKVTSVGGFMNYSLFSRDFSLRILDERNNVLESWNILDDAPIEVDGVNKGEFRGFERSSADIKAFELLVSNGGGAVIDDLVISGLATVPIPATLALMGLGLAGLGWSKRKKA